LKFAHDMSALIIAQSTIWVDRSIDIMLELLFAFQVLDSPKMLPRQP